MGRPRIHPEFFFCELCFKSIRNLYGAPLIRFCSKKCYGKSGEINISGLQKGRAWNKGLLGYRKGHPGYVKMKGENNPAWKGGITPENTRIRNSNAYKKWRVEVMERDNFTCQFCSKRGGDLHVDHIKPFSKFPDLRMEISNGRTLCVPCHKKTDTWAGKVFHYEAS